MWIQLGKSHKRYPQILTNAEYTSLSISLNNSTCKCLLHFVFYDLSWQLTEFEYNPEQDIDEDDQIVTLRAYMQPLLLDSMTKDTDEKVEHFIV
jgi:hypothetical protein